MSQGKNKIRSHNLQPVLQDLLLRYVQGRATVEEQRIIEEQLPGNPFLADALEGLMQSGSQQHEKELEAIRQHIKEKSKPPIRETLPLRRWMQLAAALVILVGVGWFVNSMLQDSTEKIFTKQFEPYPPTAGVLPPPDNIDTSVDLEEKSTSHSVPPEMKKQMQQNLPAEEPVRRLSNNEVQSLKNSMEEENKIQDRSAVGKNTLPDVSAASEALQAEPLSMDSGIEVKVAPSLTQVYVDQHQEDEQLQELSKKAEEGYAHKSIEEMKGENAVMNEALKFYHQGYYAEAVARLEAILSDDQPNVEAIFYAGICYLALKQADRALSKFKQLEEPKNSSYYEASLWYTSLAYVQLEKKEEAINILEKIILLEGQYKSQAEDLLKTLN